MQEWALSHAQRLPIEGLEVPIAPPEYVIVRKLEYFREGGSEKHLRDIAAMLRHLGERIDRERLDSVVAELGLMQQWNRVPR